VDSFIIALHAVGLSSLSGAINVLSTVGYAKRATFSLQASSLYTWSLVVVYSIYTATSGLSPYGPASTTYVVLAGPFAMLYDGPRYGYPDLSMRSGYPYRGPFAGYVST